MHGLNALFNPEKVAVIGASRSPKKIGNAILHNLIRSRFPGKIIPVNPREEEIAGIKCYPSMTEVPFPVDLGIIVVPEKAVLSVAEDCGKAGCKALIVITAGFKETGSEGLRRERDLVSICRKYNMRMLGPNCVGLMDTHTPLNASFARGFPKEGNISFISQSGAMVLSILDWSFDLDLGFSRFISLGNKADLNEIDFIQSCIEDPYTRAIICYLEDVTDGKRFLEICSEAGRKKPIIVFKAGTSSAGARAASSHTGALAGSNRAYDTAFRQCGIMRAAEMNELFELAVAFAHQPLPQSERVAIITNAGGPAIIATDAVERYGLTISRFEKETIEKLRQNLPPESNFYNPVDVLGDAPEERYRLALETVFSDPNVDNVLVLLCPTAVTEPEETARTLLKIKEKYAEKTLFAVYMGGRTLEAGKKILTGSGIPTFSYPEPAARAVRGMVHFVRHVESSRRQETPVDPGPLDRDAVEEILEQAAVDRRLVLLGHECSAVAQAYGIPVSPIILAESAEEAGEIAEQIGFPVVLKISSPRISHKSDVGGVAVGLQNRSQVERTFQSMVDRVRRLLPEVPIYGVEVQKMVDSGTEVIIGMSRDVQFGPLIVFGLGGIYVNLLEDASFRFASRLNTREAIEEMISETKAHTILRGYRGKKKGDIPALIDAVARVARLALDFEEITEMDLNPVRVFPRGLSALDIKITINREK